MNELDEIMSDNGEAVSDALEQPQQQPRDETGRFAPKQDTQPVQEQIEQPVAETSQEEAHHQGGIPPARLKAEAEKRREAEAENAALRREVAEIRGMLQANRQPAPQPQQEQHPASIWDDPDNYLKSQLTPVQQQMQETREMLWELQASQQHGADKVTAAKEAAQALAGTPQGAALHQQVMAGGNPFANLVKWHQQQQVISRIGDDPDAWFQAEFEKRLSDPAEQARVLERIRSGATANINRAQPIVSLPPSLNRLPAGGNQPADSDMSDEAIFSHAMR